MIEKAPIPSQPGVSPADPAVPPAFPAKTVEVDPAPPLTGLETIPALEDEEDLPEHPEPSAPVGDYVRDIQQEFEEQEEEGKV